MRTNKKFIVVKSNTASFKVGDIVYSVKDKPSTYTNDITLERYGNDYGLIDNHFKVVPFDIYHSPLYKIMRENDEV